MLFLVYSASFAVVALWLILNLSVEKWKDL